MKNKWFYIAATIICFILLILSYIANKNNYSYIENLLLCLLSTTIGITGTLTIVDWYYKTRDIENNKKLYDVLKWQFDCVITELYYLLGESIDISKYKLNYKMILDDDILISEIKRLKSYMQNLYFAVHGKEDQIKRLESFKKEFKGLKEILSNTQKNLDIYIKCYGRILEIEKYLPLLEDSIIYDIKKGALNPHTFFLGLFFEFCFVFIEEIRNVDKNLIKKIPKDLIVYKENKNNNTPTRLQ